MSRPVSLRRRIPVDESLSREAPVFSRFSSNLKLEYFSVRFKNVLRKRRGRRELEAGFEFTGIDQKTNSPRGMGPATGIESLPHDENRCGAISGKLMRGEVYGFNAGFAREDSTSRARLESVVNKSSRPPGCSESFHFSRREHKGSRRCP